MPEVYIDKLTLENFGPYYGEYVFNFSPLEERRGILIGGKNGAGKTHLLRALYLAVVGEPGVIDLRKIEPASEATRFVFDRALNRRAREEGQDTIRLSVTVSQHGEAGGGGRKAELVREIRYRPQSPPVWNSYADRLDGSGRTEEPKTLEKLRDALLPRHLARFFFFDAERGQNFSLGEKKITEGISRILGLWSYGELEDDLRGLISTKIPRVFYGSGQDEDRLAEVSGQIVTMERQLTARKDELENAERTLVENQTELGEVEEELKSLGVIDPKELEQVQENRTKLAETKTSLKSELASAWEQAIPVALMGNYRRELHESLVREEDRRTWESSKSTVEPKIPQVKQDVFGQVPSDYQLASKVQAFYVERLEKALHRLFHPPPEGMAKSIFITDRNDRSSQIRGRLTTGTSSLENVIQASEQVESVEANLRELDGKIKQFNQDAVAIEQGRQLHTRRGELTTKRSHLEKKKEEIEQDIHTLQSKLQELKREETNLTESVNKVRQGRALAALAGRYREAATQVRERAADQLRQQISEYVGDLWIEIAERKQEFLGIEFDKSWKCWLIRHGGERTAWDNTNPSAGQRQVRMLAFYEALRRLAKIAPPLVVDTPLGRLDREVKDSVLDKLYLRGHQTVILTTNSEIEPGGSLFERIQDKIGRVYTLHPHKQTDSDNYQVRVSNDYFGAEL